jgi:AcrR family transcriptional regulator
MTWKRARSDEQKEQRVRELTDTAARLYETTPLAEITIAMIAREAGWTRSNVYKYFATKEEVFLELLRFDVAAWCGDVEVLCKGWSGSTSDFAQAWAELPMRNLRMVELMTVLLSVLERNCSVERLTAFKAALREDMVRIGQALSEALPFRDAEAVTGFLQASSSLLMGSAPLWSPTEKQLEAMDNADYPHDEERIRRVYVEATETLLCAALEDAPKS